MLALVLDLRPLSFTENQEVMACLLQAVFEAGQSIPLGVTVDKKGYIPSRTAICNAIEDMLRELRITFKEKHLNSVLSTGGAITTDVVTLKCRTNTMMTFNCTIMLSKPPKHLRIARLS